MNELESIAREYFSRMRKGDLGVLDLFHDDAVLEGLGAHTSGKNAIREFYSKTIEAGPPQPSEPLTLLADATKVVAEVKVQLLDGSSIHAVDIFEVEDGRIRKLTYFIAEHPSS